MSRHVSVDIGGSVARCCLAEFDGESLSVEGLHTISNRPIRCGGQWFWNAEGLFTGILEALAKARDRH
ncbi:MAG: hypothetical protein FWG74_03615, partial [Planctomycetes bacterium]|nr:hypothetical protein [Planctomycetota bacterium]